MTDFDDVFKEIAKDMNTTVKDVRSSIEELARIGMKSSKAHERHFWLQIPKKGDVPTAEEIIAFLSLMVINGSAQEESCSEKNKKPPLQ